MLFAYEGCALPATSQAPSSCPDCRWAWLPDRADALLLFAGWFLVCVPRPFLLGFYHDDWNLLACANTPWLEIFRMGLARPGLVTANLLSSWLLPHQAAVWHGLGALVCLGLLVVVRQACLAVLLCLQGDAGEAMARRLASLVALIWLALPWTLGYTAWPVMFFALPSLLFLCLSMVALLRLPWRLSTAVLVAALQLAGFLFYEAFWGCGGPLLLLFVVGRERALTRRVWLTGASLVLPQLAAVGWNRFANSLGAVSKSVNPAWLETFKHQLSITPQTLLASFGKLESVALFLGLAALVGLLPLGKSRPKAFLPLVLCGLAVFCVVFGHWSVVRQNEALFCLALLCCLGLAFHWREIVTFAGFAAAAVLSILLLALAGYGVVGEGLWSRTTIALTFWGGLAFGVAVMRSLRGVRSRGAAMCLWAALWGLFLTCVVANHLQMRAWATAWEQGRETLARVKALPLARDTITLVDIPSAPPVEVFSAFWDLGAAVTGDFLEKTYFASRTGMFSSHWDGKEFFQQSCQPGHARVWSFPAAAVRYIPPQGTEAVFVAPGFRLDCPAQDTVR